VLLVLRPENKWRHTVRVSSLAVSDVRRWNTLTQCVYWLFLRAHKQCGEEAKVCALTHALILINKKLFDQSLFEVELGTAQSHRRIVPRFNYNRKE
jgi:hypothetical protein